MVFHLFAILVKVVLPDDMRICRILLLNLAMSSSVTCKNAWAVRSFVWLSTSAQTESLTWNSSFVFLHLGRIRTSNPFMENSKLGLSLE